MENGRARAQGTGPESRDISEKTFDSNWIAKSGKLREGREREIQKNI